MKRYTPRFRKTIDQTAYDRLLNLLRAAPESRSAADVETIDCSFRSHDELAFGKVSKRNGIALDHHRTRYD